MKKDVDIQTAVSEPFCRQGKTWLNQNSKNWRWKTSPADFSRGSVPVGDGGETSDRGASLRSWYRRYCWIFYNGRLTNVQTYIQSYAYVTYWFCIHIQIETPSCDPATSNGPFDGAVVEEVPIQRKFIFT